MRHTGLGRNILNGAHRSRRDILYGAHQASRLKRVELLSQRDREVSPSVGCGAEVLEKSERSRSSMEQCTGTESLLAMMET